MGTNSSKQSLEIMNEYNFVGIRQDEGYGEIQLYSNKIKRTEQMALIKLFDASDIVKRQQIIELRAHSNNFYFTKILDYYLQTTDDLCSNINLLHVGLEYLEKSLQDDIIDRRKNQKTYNEGELWYLVQAVLTGLRDLQLQNLQYSDLHPNHIRITMTGEVKLLELICLTNQQSAYQKVFTQIREVEYLSPEQLYVLENEQQNPNQEYSVEKQNLFTLGVIFLVCITSMDVKEFYNNFTFNSELANRKLNSAFDKYNYSEPMKHLLSDLLQLNAFHRPTYIEILDKLSHVDSSRISPHLYALNQQDQAIQSMHFKSQSNTQEVIIESQPQSLFEQQNANDSFNRQITSNFQANLESAPVYESNYSNMQQESNYQNNKIPLNSQAGLDKIRQLKERFQLLKGEIPNQAPNTVPTTFTHSDDTETFKIQPQFQQNPYSPNFLEMDPIIQRALQKSREVMSRCNPYQQVETYVPILPQTILTPPLIPNTLTNSNYPQQNNYQPTFSQQSFQNQIPMFQSQIQQQQPLQLQQPYIEQFQQSPVRTNEFNNLQATPPSQNYAYNQNNIQQLLQQAEIEIQKSNQISQKYFQQVKQQ